MVASKVSGFRGYAAGQPSDAPGTDALLSPRLRNLSGAQRWPLPQLISKFWVPYIMLPQVYTHPIMGVQKTDSLTNCMFTNN